MAAPGHIPNHETFGSIRAIERGGQPWFIAKDVCDCLELGNTTEALRGLYDDEKFTLSNPEGNPRAGIPLELNIISEPGLYSLILRSRKPEAKAFKRWLVHEVIPDIRRHGVYATPQTVEAMLNDPETTIKILTALKEERAQRQALEARAEVDRPKVVFADSIEVSRSTILVGELAKLVKQSTGRDIGQRRMRLSKRIEKLEGQQRPRLMLIGVRDLDGTVWADVPGRGRETFDDTQHFKECAATLSMSYDSVEMQYGPRLSNHDLDDLQTFAGSKELQKANRKATAFWDEMVMQSGLNVNGENANQDDKLFLAQKKAEFEDMVANNEFKSRDDQKAWIYNALAKRTKPGMIWDSHYTPREAQGKTGAYVPVPDFERSEIKRAMENANPPIPATEENIQAAYNHRLNTRGY